MSAPEDPRPRPAPSYTGGQIAMIVFGALFLLPGLCSLLFALGAVADLVKGDYPGDGIGALVVLWVFCFGIAALGIGMIRTARKRAREPS